MSERVVAINDSIHEEVQRLLSWFVVDALAGNELELVNQHLNVCAECQTDFAWQCRLQAATPASDAKPDADRAFSELRQRLDATPRSARRRNLAALPGKFWPGNGRWMHWAIAAQFLAIIGLAIMVATPYGNVTAYRALGASQITKGNVVVVFKPETSERELRHILQAAGAHIVDGPTVSDAYMLDVAEEKLAGALQGLRSESAVVLAESLGFRGRR